MSTPITKFMTVILAVLSGIVTAREHVQVDMTWKNATAEELKNQLTPISNHADLTIVGDGKATMFFYAEPSEVAKIQRDATGSLAKSVIFVRMERVQGDIPPPPGQVAKKIAIMTIQRDKAVKLGVSISDISSHIQGLRGMETEESKMGDKINASNITLPNGTQVPLRNFVEVSMVEVKRPLILKKDEPPNSP